jgi:hypothetical protein
VVAIGVQVNVSSEQDTVRMANQTIKAFKRVSRRIPIRLYNLTSFTEKPLGELK